MKLKGTMMAKCANRSAAPLKSKLPPSITYKVQHSESHLGMKSASADRLTGWRMGECPLSDTATANTTISPATGSLITTGVELWAFSTVVF